ncbi:MAG: N-formylglutamate amidohydrolase [Pseudomonadota bacterium]
MSKRHASATESPTNGESETGDPPAYEIVNPAGVAQIVVICDHAKRCVPHRLGDLGLPPEAFEKHIAYDIGAADAARYLAHSLDAVAVLSGFSRLVIDPNRQLNDLGSVPEISDGTPVPGNQALSDLERKRRQEQCFFPYHDTVTAKIDAVWARSGPPAVLSIHSCTDEMNGAKRPWEIGVLYDDDARIAHPLIEVLRQQNPDLTIGDNQPYSGKDPSTYSIYAHGINRGIPHVGIEIRQDLIGTKVRSEYWAEILRKAFSGVLDNPALFQAVTPSAVAGQR